MVDRYVLFADANADANAIADADAIPMDGGGSEYPISNLNSGDRIQSPGFSWERPRMANRIITTLFVNVRPAGAEQKHGNIASLYLGILNLYRK